MDTHGQHPPPVDAITLSLLPWGEGHIKATSAFPPLCRRELRGDPKRLVREAGGDSPLGGSARR
jgi:hypothetical protein